MTDLIVSLPTALGLIASILLTSVVGFATYFGARAVVRERMTQDTKAAVSSVASHSSSSNVKFDAKHRDSRHNPGQARRSS